MLRKGKYFVHPHLIAKELLGLKFSSPGVKEDWNWQPRSFGDYSHYNMNIKSLIIAAFYTIKYVRSLDPLIREAVIADPTLVLVYILKVDVRNGFYQKLLQPRDAPNMGLVLLSDGNVEELVAISITLPMGC